MTAAATSADGRTARRDHNRELVLDAVLELFAEGRLLPAAPDVAERSGVSLRSVFRYYDDTDALVRAAIARHVERIAPLFELDAIGEGPFEDRVVRFVAARLRLYRAVAPTARATILRAPTNPILAEQLATVVGRLRAQLEAMFAPELAARTPARRRTVAAAADTLVQFPAVEHLRVQLGLTERQAAAVLQHGLTAVLGVEP